MKKIHWGVLGTAHIAEKQTIPGMQNAKNCELYAIAGRSMEKAKDFQNRFGFQKAYGSYEELLEDPEVEAVYIPLPNHLHKEWVLKAAAHKKHILCEKPMSGSAKDTRDIIQACEDAGVILMEAFAYLHSPLMQKLKLQIEEGLIGDVNFIESTFIPRDTRTTSAFTGKLWAVLSTIWDAITLRSRRICSEKLPSLQKPFLILQRNILMI